MKHGCLIAPTAADIRDVMVEGPSGLLAVAPPWYRPRFEPSKRRVTWPNGARAVCLSGEEPERARGFNIYTLWADELACWQRAESTWDLAMLALRAGTNPQALITKSPRRHAVLKRILAEPTTVQTTDTTYANQAHLPREFLTQIIALYENTQLGRQEIYAEFLDTTEGVWFASFDPARHVSLEAEYDPAWFVRCAIDAGTSRHTAAVFFQVRADPVTKRPRVTVFADYHALNVVSQKNALAIKKLADELPCRGRIDLVRVDPAATARSSLGPAAYSEYERVFGQRILAR
jgi:phage terminase large subunit-like protein